MPGIRRMRSASSTRLTVIALPGARCGALPIQCIAPGGRRNCTKRRLRDRVAFLFQRLLDLLTAHLLRVELDRYLLRLDRDRDVLDARHRAHRLLDRVLAVL